MNTNAKLLAIKAEIFEMGLKFNQEPSDAKITAYAKELMNYTPAQINFAFKQVIHVDGSDFFPSLAAIIKHLKPKDLAAKDMGNDISNEVIQKVIEFGIYRIQDAFKALSDDAKKAIGDNTYILSDIANSDRDQLPTLRAQLRDMAAASVEKQRQSTRNQKLQSIGISVPGQLLDFPKKEMKPLGYENILDEVEP